MTPRKPEPDPEPLTAEERKRLEQWAQATLKNLGLTLDGVRRLADPYKPVHMRIIFDPNDFPRHP